MNAFSHLTRRCASSSRFTTTALPTTTTAAATPSKLLLSSSSSPSLLLLPISPFHNHYNNNTCNPNNNYCYHNIRSIHTSSPTSSSSTDRHGTTIVCVRKNGRVCMMGDGMVSMGSIIVKPNAKKIRRIRPKSSSSSSTGGESGSSKPTEGDSSEEKDKREKEEEENGGTIVGFAGTTADAFTLLERLESKLDEYPGQLARSCVELAKGWRTDKYLRRLEASLLVADAKASFEITGNGDVLESHDGVLGVGSGSAYAMAAARALMEEPNLSAEDVAKRAMRIASEMCIYTNDNFTMESMAVVDKDEDEKRLDD